MCDAAWNAANLRWDFKVINAPASATVWHGTNITRHFVGTYSVNTLPDASVVLQIINVNTAAAGLYRCLNTTTGKAVNEVELTVIGRVLHYIVQLGCHLTQHSVFYCLYVAYSLRYTIGSIKAITYTNSLVP